MFGIIGIIGCVVSVVLGVCAGVAALASVASCVVSGVTSGQQLSAQENSATQRKAFEDKQLGLHKADKARQALINRASLHKQRGQIFSSIALKEISMQADARESGRLRRDNTLNGAGLDVGRSKIPLTKGYSRGNPVG